MDAAHNSGVEKFVFLGSSCIYPKFAKQPIPETELLNGHLEETNSAYAIAKIAGIELIKSYRKQFGHKWISVMPANLYGPRDNFDVQNGHVLPVLISKFHNAVKNNNLTVELWGDGSPYREFLFVDDLSKAIIFCLEKYDSDDHINIGSGREISIADLANSIAKTVNFSGKIIWNSEMPNGTPRKILDSAKIRSLGWSPDTSLEIGISETYSWYKHYIETKGLIV
jgi:GDP-L-fucose synthase